ncbi:Protein eyes shut [Manis javanica]|nr:Protein eyes shut [Manis javanica]
MIPFCIPCGKYTLESYDAGLFLPSFNENSFLELPFLATLDKLKFVLENKHNRIVTIYLTIKANTLNGTVLYSVEKNFGHQFLHLFLVEERLTVKYGCGSPQNTLTLSANYSISTNAFIPITIRGKFVCPEDCYCLLDM